MELISLFLILFIPFFLQIKYGVRALYGWTKLKFWELTASCLFAEIFLSFFLFYAIVFIKSFFASPNQDPRCGFGLAGIAIFGIPISILIFITALIQKVIHKNNS
ncbi:MAG TPA: hypothetical protein VN192_04530 [Flavobacterium sp.]|nr:hypothetical protein [Flavobacterium sp.]